MLNPSYILFYFLLVFVCYLFICLFHYRVKQCSISKASIQHPPSPPALPIIGHLHLLGPILPKSFQSLATRYGPLMRLRFASSTAVIVSNATIAKEILKDKEMNFVSRPRYGYSDYDIYDGYAFVFAEYGTYWRFLKKLCITQLLSVSQMSRFADIRRQESMKLLETLAKCSEEGKTCNLGMEVSAMTNNVICRMVMSTRCSSTEDESKLVWELVQEAQRVAVKLMFGEILGPLGKLDLFGYGKKLKTLLMKFDALVERIMVEHEKDINFGKKERKDMMDILLEIARDEKSEMNLTRIAIKSFILELFVAGTDTTSLALQWILAELINHPIMFKKLREEIYRVVGSKRLVEESDVPNLPYLQAVVKEGLRLHPSVPLNLRKCDKNIKINGYDILANERIVINLAAIQKDPDSWENPLDFQPERFLEKSHVYDHYQMDIRRQNFNMMPFGSGRRGCPGAPFALLVIHVGIARLVQCFDFKVEGGQKISMEEGPEFSTRMAHPFYAILLQMLIICNL